MKKVLDKIYRFLEELGRARAASVLVQQRRYKEAQNLMLGK